MSRNGNENNHRKKTEKKTINWGKGDQICLREPGKPTWKFKVVG